MREEQKRGGRENLVGIYKLIKIKNLKNLETDLVIRKASLDVLFLLRSSVDSLFSEEDCLIERQLIFKK